MMSISSSCFTLNKCDQSFFCVKGHLSSSCADFNEAYHVSFICVLSFR